MAKRDLREEIQILRDINKETEAQLKKEKEIDTTLKRRQGILNSLESNLDDYIKVKKIIKEWRSVKVKDHAKEVLYFIEEL